MVVVGYLLSPLSWWNDIFINIPLAYAFGSLISLIHKSLFMPFVIIGYWITNILGFIMLHHGVKGLRKSEFQGGGFRKNLIISIIYTFVVVLLIELHILKLPF